MQMFKEVLAEVGDDALGNPGGQITVAHRAEALQEDEPEEEISSVILDWSCWTVMTSHNVPANRSRARLIAATTMTSRPARAIRER